MLNLTHLPVSWTLTKRLPSSTRGATEAKFRHLKETLVRSVRVCKIPHWVSLLAGGKHGDLPCPACHNIFCYLCQKHLFNALCLWIKWISWLFHSRSWGGGRMENFAVLHYWPPHHHPHLIHCLKSPGLSHSFSNTHPGKSFPLFSILAKPKDLNWN